MMVNIEKNNRINRRTPSRRIEVYRKTSAESDYQLKSDDVAEPKLIDKEDKMFFLKAGLMISFVILSFIIFISSSLFNNPFGDIPENTKYEEAVSVKTISADQPVKSEEKSSIFFDKEGNIKITNVSLAAGATFVAISFFRAIIGD